MIRREAKDRKETAAAKLYAFGCIGCSDKCMVITENPDKPHICPYQKNVPEFIQQKRR